jgi:hypothetical protein
MCSQTTVCRAESLTGKVTAVLTLLDKWACSLSHLVQVPTKSLVERFHSSKDRIAQLEPSLPDP